MSNRYEREIEELLKRMDGQLRPEPIPFRVRRRTARAESVLRSFWRGFLRRTPVEQFMLLSIALGLLSYGLHLFSSRLAFFAGILSIVLLVLAITISVASRRGGGYAAEKRWRGRPIQTGGPAPFWWILVRDWWRRRRRY